MADGQELSIHGHAGSSPTVAFVVSPTAEDKTDHDIRFAGLALHN